MLFRKIDIPKGPGYKGPHWYMCIQTIDELMKYHDVDAELFGQALVNLPVNKVKSHLSGPREIGINSSIESALMTQEKVSPIVVTAKLINQKLSGMMKVLEMGETLLVQESGSYCGYESFMNIWKHCGANVIAEVYSDGLGFPRDEVREVDLVFLENAERVDVEFFNDVYYREGLDYQKKNFVKVENLKCVDTKWLFKQLEKCKKISFYTQFANPDQVQRMVGMFMMLDKKEFIVRSNWKHEIVQQDWYEGFSQKHNIIWI